MLEDCSNYVYDTVFVFPTWEAIYKQDAERIEVFEQAEHFHKALVDTYTYFGMQCIEVPKASIEERLSFITEQL